MIQKKIAIIGGGYSGLGLVFHLFQQPHVAYQVTVLDPHMVGHGGSV